MTKNNKRNTFIYTYYLYNIVGTRYIFFFRYNCVKYIAIWPISIILTPSIVFNWHHYIQNLFLMYIGIDVNRETLIPIFMLNEITPFYEKKIKSSWYSGE